MSGYEFYSRRAIWLQKKLQSLKKLPVKVIEVSFESSTKSKALNKAMEILRDDYNVALVLDADNLMETDFISKINLNNTVDMYFEKDDPLVQVYDNFRETFGNEEAAVILFKDDNIFSNEKLKIIREDKENQQTFDFPWKKVQKHLKTELFKDQWSACAFIYYCEGYGVINYSMGLGKSLISIAYALYLKHVTKTSKRALIFCPNIVKSSWSKELGKHTYEKYTTIENGSELVLKNLDDYLKSDNYFLVVHYDAIKTRTTKNKKTKKTETEDRIINFIIEYYLYKYPDKKKKSPP